MRSLESTNYDYLYEVIVRVTCTHSDTDSSGTFDDVIDHLAKANLCTVVKDGWQFFVQAESADEAQKAVELLLQEQFRDPAIRRQFNVLDDWLEVCYHSVAPVQNVLSIDYKSPAVAEG